MKEHFRNDHTDSVITRRHFLNAYGKGPMTIVDGYSLFIYDDRGNCVEIREYSYFDNSHVSAHHKMKYDTNSRLIESEHYTYDYQLKKVKYTHGRKTIYNSRGLEVLDVMYTNDQKVMTISKKKYQFY